LKLKGFMDQAYGGKVRGERRLDEKKGEFLLGFEDLAQRLNERPKRAQVEDLAPKEADSIVDLVISASPKDKREEMIWGILSSLAAERLSVPMVIPPRNFPGLELKKGAIILDGNALASGPKARASGGAGQTSAPWTRAHHLGERMSGGRLVVQGGAGDYLGQEMEGGGIVCASCGDYAFRNMAGGWGVVKGDAGNYLGVGNSGGRIAVKGRAGARAGWLMRSGRIWVGKDAGDYLGLMMSGGSISAGGKAGPRAGWRMKGGLITADGYGPEAGAEKVGGRILRRKAD
jgi:formylmethanofuran dehydrogenase subunit C